MSFNNILKYTSVAIGIVVTLFILMAFGPKIVGLFMEKGWAYFTEVVISFSTWHDDPTAFFFSYLIGYTLIWWKPLSGSTIIIAADVLFFAFNSENMSFFTLFLMPTFSVAGFYILSWVVSNRTKNDALPDS